MYLELIVPVYAKKKVHKVVGNDGRLQIGAVQCPLCQ